MSGGGQLALPFPINERCVFGNFQVGANAELLEHLHRMPHEPGFAGMMLWGALGAGISHLLQASCQLYAEQGRRVAYLPLARLGRQAEILDGMDGFDLVALDDVQAWASEPALETGLVGLYQNLLARGRHLLVGSSATVAASGFELADLASRLAGLTAYQVGSLDDQGKTQLLRNLAAERGLGLNDAVLRFWLARTDRTVGRLLDQFEQIDAAAMSAQRRVTIPLVKSVLDL
ncbi:MAG: DnaA/Hda family protein [Gammaproteobacteria bacterium]|nr:DnaA/Hda family protein [Gammaproteobacteria bacterium]